MTKNMLVDAVGMIDVAYIEEYMQNNALIAARRSVRKRRAKISALISAACLLLVISMLCVSLPLFFIISPNVAAKSVHELFMPEDVQDSIIGDWTNWNITERIFDLLRMSEEDSAAAKLQQSSDRGLMGERFMTAGKLLDELYQYYLEHQKKDELSGTEQGKEEPEYPIPIPEVSEGLTFRKTASGKYRVTGIKENEEGIVCIPAEHEGIRVVEIDRELFKNNSWIKELYVLGGVGAIQYNSFSECQSLELVYLGDSITQIQDYAFFECPNLKEVYLSNHLKEIGIRAFEGCVSLKSISIPDATKKIGIQAFYGCTSLETVDMPAEMTSLGDRVFYGCAALKEVVMPAGITEVGESMFGHCSSLESVIIPDGYVLIGSNAFYNCVSLKTVIMPDSITVIGEDAFSCCGISEIKISANVTEIRNRAFFDCRQLKTVTVGAELTEIGDYAFQNTSVSEYFYAGTQAQWKKIYKGTKWFGHSYTVHCSDGDI